MGVLRSLFGLWAGGKIAEQLDQENFLHDAPVPGSVGEALRDIGKARITYVTNMGHERSAINDQVADYLPDGKHAQKQLFFHVGIHAPAIRVPSLVISPIKDPRDLDVRKNSSLMGAKTFADIDSALEEVRRLDRELQGQKQSADPGPNITPDGQIASPGLLPEP